MDLACRRTASLQQHAEGICVCRAYVAELLGVPVDALVQAAPDCSQVHGLVHILGVFWVYLHIHRRIEDAERLAQVVLNLLENAQACAKPVSTALGR